MEKQTLEEWYVEFQVLLKQYDLEWMDTGDLLDYEEAHEDELSPRDYIGDEISYSQ